MLNKRKKSLTVVIFIFSALLLFSIWLLQDSEPLDYSSLEVEIGVEDPAINGYTLMRQFADTYEATGLDDYDLAQQQEVADWNIQAVRSAIEQNQELIETFSTALSMDHFAIDQPARPETLIPEVGDIRDYFRLRIFEARLTGYEQPLSSEFGVLLGLSEEAEVYAKQRGGLISLLTSVAIVGILEQEYYRLLGENLSTQQCIEFAKNYSTPEIWPQVIQDAYRQEFWFSSYCVEQVKKDPSEFMGAMSAVGETAKLRLLYSDLLFKVNRTTNMFFAINAEIVRAAPLPVNERDLSLNNQLMAKAEERPFAWWVSRNVVGKILYSILVPSSRRVLELSDERIAYGRLLQLAYALKAYHTDTGSLPDRLNSLIPSYLDSVPIDPFNGEPLRYSKKRGIVYSVGSDFVDNGGSHHSFVFTYKWDDDYDDVAEQDTAEPTLALRFLPMHQP